MKGRCLTSLLLVGMLNSFNSGCAPNIRVDVPTSAGELEMTCNRVQNSYVGQKDQQTSYSIYWIDNEDNQIYNVINSVENEQFQSLIINKKINDYEVPFSIDAGVAVGSVNYCKSIYEQIDNPYNE